ncbi:hypothetical protein [Peterkaempfera bronchialis]|uniref:Secreted protein n=1 Tax=Peterkaempfera bronchialis TaxID=2126346 RepID=A0A345SVH0_9ACTN|nr:hypothetical protein [Peterkaempfera bronchialis]AXI77725.1 hypothetical protein C7M71_010070 [Peterkaempfera bronchialis]
MRRTAALAAAALLASLPLSLGCSAAEKAWDCGKLAVQITSDVQKVQSAALHADDDPGAVDTALGTLGRDLDRLGKQTGNADVGKAVQDLRDQADALRRSADAGSTPDLAPLVSAAGRLSTVCTG